MVAVPTLLLNRYQPRRGQLGEMAARRLRRDTGNTSKLGCGERTPVHESMQHSGASGISSECRNFGKQSRAGQCAPPDETQWSEAAEELMLRRLP